MDYILELYGETMLFAEKHHEDMISNATDRILDEQFQLLELSIAIQLLKMNKGFKYKSYNGKKCRQKSVNI